jgi:predicted GNAT family acetyltransferase
VVAVTLAAPPSRRLGDAYPVDIEITDNPSQNRYEARLGQDVIGFIDYHLRPGRITLLHTEVDSAAEGTGVGSQLVAGTLEDIRGRGLSVVVVCPFIRAYIRRHPEYADVVAAR